MMTNSSAGQENKIISQSDWLYVFTLLSIGFLTRMIFFSQIYLISLDGAFQYIPVARLFAWGEYREAFNQPQLPLYPFLIAIVSKVTGHFETSGQMISFISSVLAVIPLFLLGKAVFNRTAAFWSCLLYLFNPEMLQGSVDVLKEGLLIFLLFSGVFLFYLFLKRRRILWLVSSMLLVLLAMLTRVASMIFIPVFLFWIFFLKRESFDPGFLKRVGYLLIVLALCMAILIPLIHNVKTVTGKWDISKKTITARFLIESVLFDKSPEIVEVERTSFALIKKIIKVYHPVLFIFLLIGIISRYTIPRDLFKEMFLFSFIFGYFVIIGLMMWSTQRYLFFPILLSYPWAGVGVVEVQGRIAGRMHLSPQKVNLGLSILILILFFPILLNPFRVEKLERKAIGLWIKSQDVWRPSIMTEAIQIAYYAEGEPFLIDPLNYERQVREAGAKRIHYIVVKEENIEKYYPNLIELTKTDFIIQNVSPFSQTHQEKYLIFKSKFLR